MPKGIRTRAWPVFLVGIGSLLALLFLPGIAALRRTSAVYREFRRVQEAHQETQRLLSEIERRVYLISITVREALIDTSENTSAYRSAFELRRREITEQLSTLRQRPEADPRIPLDRLDQELDGYFAAIEPMFTWAPSERAVRATYFLRQQQRPRRQSIIQIADEIGRLTEASYSKQLEQLNQSQIKFGEDIQRVIALAFLIGIIIASVTLVRMVTLEERAERHRVKTEKAEEELRSLTNKLMHAQEEERKSISRELHDEVGQLLTGLRMGLGGLERLRQDPEAFHEQISEVKALAEQSLRSVRDLAGGLRPSVLDLGLVPAVEWQARRFSKYSGIPATVHPAGELEEIPEEYRICIYRVVQECLTNAVKHSGARSVRIDILERDRMLDVMVHDDGTGFAQADNQPGGLGLVGMEERVRELGGVLRIESAPEKGTAVRVRLAVPAKTA